MIDDVVNIKKSKIIISIFKDNSTLNIHTNIYTKQMYKLTKLFTYNKFVGHSTKQCGYSNPMLSSPSCDVPPENSDGP